MHDARLGHSCTGKHKTQILFLVNWRDQKLVSTNYSTTMNSD